MFVGHYAVGLAAKRIQPAASLFALFTAAMLADILYSIFLIAGIEHVAISPGITRVNALNLYDFPLSHSLVTDAIWAALFAAIFFLRTRSARSAWIIAAAVLSHWVLDFISHRPDMPLAPGVHKYFGLGLWNSVVGTAIVEGTMWLAAIFLYVRATHAKTRTGFYAFWIPVALFTLLWVTSLNGAPPPSVAAVKIVNVVIIGLTLLWTYWLDRVRTSTELASQAQGAS